MALRCVCLVLLCLRLVVTSTARRFGIEFLLRLKARRDGNPLRNFFTRWRWAVGAFHAKSHIRRCTWTHGQYRHEGTGEAQGDGTEVVNSFWKQFHNILTNLLPAIYDATVELIGDWWNESRTWQTVKILKRNVNTHNKNLIRYGERRAELEAKYKMKPTEAEIAKWRAEVQQSATAQPTKAAASIGTTEEVFVKLADAKDLSTSLSEFKQYTELLPTKALEQDALREKDEEDALSRIFAGLSIHANKAMKLNNMDRKGLGKRISTVANERKRLKAAAKQRCLKEAKDSDSYVNE